MKPPSAEPSWSPRRAAGRRVVCLDFDGTITEEDVLLSLFQRHARPGWTEHEQRWRAGEISSAECMRAQLRLVDLPLSAWYRHIDGVAVDPDVAEFVARVMRGGGDVLVLSDGLDLYIHRILARAGLDLDVVCNAARYGPRGVTDLEPPGSPAEADEAGNFKGPHVRRLRERYGHVTFVGDGLSDRGAAAAADLVFAKGELREYCEARGIAHVSFTRFADLLPLAGAAAPGPGHPGLNPAADPESPPRAPSE